MGLDSSSLGRAGVSTYCVVRCRRLHCFMAGCRGSCAMVSGSLNVDGVLMDG